MSVLVGMALGALVPQIVLWSTLDWAERRNVHPITHLVASHIVGVSLAVLMIAWLYGAGA
jgi:uncharacterized membrane protein YidH (DUF202 family)